MIWFWPLTRIFAFQASDPRRLQVAACGGVQARSAALDRLAYPASQLRFASRHARRPLKAVQELLGHSDITMTMRYAHLSADARRDAVGLLDAHNHGNLTATGAREA
jgi:integrase